MKRGKAILKFTTSSVSNATKTTKFQAQSPAVRADYGDKHRHVNITRTVIAGLSHACADLYVVDHTGSLLLYITPH